MASEADYKVRYEELRETHSQTMESWVKTKNQLSEQKTMTMLVGVGAVVLGAAAGYVAGVLRVGR